VPAPQRWRPNSRASDSARTIVEYIRYRIHADQATAFEDAYRDASASLDASPHGQRFDVARCRVSDGRRGRPPRPEEGRDVASNPAISPVTGWPVGFS